MKKLYTILAAILVSVTTSDQAYGFNPNPYINTSTQSYQQNGNPYPQFQSLSQTQNLAQNFDRFNAIANSGEYQNISIQSMMPENENNDAPEHVQEVEAHEQEQQNQPLPQEHDATEQQLLSHEPVVEQQALSQHEPAVQPEHPAEKNETISVSVLEQAPVVHEHEQDQKEHKNQDAHQSAVQLPLEEHKDVVQIVAHEQVVAHEQAPADHENVVEHNEQHIELKHPAIEKDLVEHKEEPLVSAQANLVQAAQSSLHLENAVHNEHHEPLASEHQEHAEHHDVMPEPAVHAAPVVERHEHEVEHIVPIEQPVAEHIKIVKVYPVYDAVCSALHSVYNAGQDMINYVYSFMNKETKKDEVKTQCQI